MVNAQELLGRIRADVDLGRFKAIELAREAGVQPSTVYTMLDPSWSNKAIDNLEALAAAHARLTNPNSQAAETAAT